MLVPRAIACLLPSLLLPVPAHGDCAPERMMKIVTRDVGPAAAGTFAEQPVTIYRYGATYARVEEEPDIETGIHGLIVTNHRDTWMVNRADGTGRHLVDRAKTYDVHAPILANFDSPLIDLEFGCEVDTMTSRGVRPKTIPALDGDVLEYSILEGKDAILLRVDPKTGKPRSLEIIEDGQTVHLLKYIAYETDLEPDLTLFRKPSGISFVEGSPPATDQPDPLAGFDDFDDEVIGYAQATDADAGEEDCTTSGPHAGSSCPQPVADESDWHLESSPQEAAFWESKCREGGEEITGLFATVSEHSAAFDECVPIDCGSLAFEDGVDFRAGAIRELLAARLNAASGRLAGPGLDESIAKVEATICNPGSTDEELENARKKLQALYSP